MVKRREPGREPGQEPEPFDGQDEFVIGFPLLWDFLTAVKYEDGGHRQTGTLTVFIDDGMVKGCLSDRDTGETAFVASRRFYGLLAAIEGGLAEGGLDWRKKKQEGGKKRR